MLDPAEKIGCLLCLLFLEHLLCAVSVKPYVYPAHVQQRHRHDLTQNAQRSSSLSYNHSRCPIFCIRPWGVPIRWHFTEAKSKQWSLIVLIKEWTQVSSELRFESTSTVHWKPTWVLLRTRFWHGLTNRIQPKNPKKTPPGRTIHSTVNENYFWPTGWIFWELRICFYISIGGFTW